MEISMRSWIFNEVDEYLMESMNIQVLIPIHIPIQGSILRIDQSEALFVRLPRVIFDDPGGSNRHNEHLHTTDVNFFRRYNLPATPVPFIVFC